MFDTEKSELIVEGQYTSGLYRTKSGTWFFVYDSLFEKAHIKLMSENDAKEIIGHYAPDRYAEFFGEPKEA